jgi:hypothetical protein
MRPEPPDREPLLDAFVAGLRHPSVADDPFGALAAALGALGVEPESVSVTVEPGNRRRLALYRRLIVARHRAALAATLPRTVELLGEERVAAALDAFLAERGARSPYLRDLARAVVEHGAARWGADPSLPPYLLELADFELARLEVAAAEDDSREPARPLTKDSRLRFQRAARLTHTEHPVHRAPPEEPGGVAPGGYWLLSYRDGGRGVRTLELSPFAAAAVQTLLDGETLERAAAAATAACGRPSCDELLSELAAVLDDLEARGVLLGAAETTPPKVRTPAESHPR